LFILQGKDEKEVEEDSVMSRSVEVEREEEEEGEGVQF